MFRRAISLKRLLPSPFICFSTSVKSVKSCNPPDRDEFKKLESIFMPKVEEYLKQNNEPDVATVIHQTSDEMFDNLLSINDDGYSLTDLSDHIDTILKYSVRTGSGTFADKLYSGSDAIGQFSSYLLSVLNTNVHTYQSGPVLTCIENAMIKEVTKVFYKTDLTSNKDRDVSNIGGIFSPGGSYSNMLAIKLARDKYFPENMTNGLANCDKIPVMLVSDQLHYSTMTAANTVGIGTDNVIKVQTNRDGTINIQECERILNDLKINSPNKKAFYINGMAGTTVFGAFDDFGELSRLAKEYDLWFHIDGCWGGAAALCRNGDKTGENNSQECLHLGNLMKNCELADSIAWDTHKYISMPILCSILMVRDEKQLMTSCAPPGAAYLFHGNSIDIGLKTLQCGRVGDALKLYLSWLYYGNKGFQERVVFGLKNARYLANSIKNSDDFILASDGDPKFANVCFYYVPQSMKQEISKWQKNGFEYNEELFHKLDKMTKTLNTHARQNGGVCIDYSPVPAHKLPTFFRAITANYRLTNDILDKILDDIRNAAKDLNVV